MQLTTTFEECNPGNENPEYILFYIKLDDIIISFFEWQLGPVEDLQKIIDIDGYHQYGAKGFVVTRYDDTVEIMIDTLNGMSDPVIFRLPFAICRETFIEMLPMLRYLHERE